MRSNVIPFRSPDAPAEGAERLAAIRAYRAACREVAAETVADAFSAASKAAKVPGVRSLGCDDALPLFVAAMRRELRKSGLF
jgi:hypothetical protein